MTMSILTRLLLILSGVGMLGSFAAVLTGFPSFGLLIASVAILVSVWSLALIMRRSIRLLSTRANNLNTRVSALKHGYDASRKVADEFNKNLIDIKASQSALQDLIKRIESSIDGMPMSSCDNHQPKQPSLSGATITSIVGSEGAIPALPSASVMAVGLTEKHAYLGGQAVRHITPFSIPALAEVKSGGILVVEESGFHRGVWKTFGEQYDTYILESLSRLGDLVDRRALKVHIVVSDDTPAHLRQPRSWGTVTESIAEVETLVASLSPALRPD